MAVPTHADVKSAAFTTSSDTDTDEGSDGRHWELHRSRKRAILAEHPSIMKLYGHDNRISIYAYTLIALQLLFAYAVSTSWYAAAFMALTIGPYVDNGILCFMHEATHMLVFKKPAHNRILSLVSNSVMLIPISEIFRQHHARHHQKLGDDNHDVDVPTDFEIATVGNSAFRKAFWLTFNMIILPLRSLGRLPVHVDRYLIANWVVCLSTGLVSLIYSRQSFFFLIISALNSQGFHPANTRMVQRHVHNGTTNKKTHGDQYRPATYSYYGPLNYLTLNVGYHVEHHDFCSIPCTRIKKLREIAGDKWYPDRHAHTGRGVYEILNFVTNKNITLADFVNHPDDKHHQ